jgi:multiple sugar transport system substrate-binding protein
MAFQEAASQRLNAALKSGEAAEAPITDLNGMFRESFAA